MTVAGEMNPGVAQLNPDGSLDPAFHAAVFDHGGGLIPVRGLVVQQNGKIVLGSKFSVLTGNPPLYAPLVRLNPDGSADASFLPATDLPYFLLTDDLVVQSDDKLISSTGHTLYRFDSDGPLDHSFAQPVLFQDLLTGDAPGTAYSLALDAAGRVVFAGFFTDVNPSGTPEDSHFGVARLNSDGTLDPTLETNHLTAAELSAADFLRLSDESTLVTFGRENSLRSIYPPIPYDFGRFLADGSIDSTFTLSPAGPNSILTPGFLAFHFAPLTDGSLFVVGETDDDLIAGGKFFSSGEEDASFAVDPAAPVFEEATALPEGQILLAAGDDPQATVEATLSRLLSDGGLDPTFQLSPSIRSSQVLRDGQGNLLQINAGSQVLAVQPDGKVLLLYLGADQLLHLVRLNAAGSVDGAFSQRTLQPLSLVQSFPPIFDPVKSYYVQPPQGAYTAISPLLDAQVLPDGRILLAGKFTSFQECQHADWCA